MKKSKILAIISCIYISNLHSEEIQCGYFKKVGPENLYNGECKCGKELSDLGIKEPYYGFALKEVCEWDADEKMWPLLFYTGSITVRGILSWNNSGGIGQYILFEDSSGKLNYRFDPYDDRNKKIKAPKKDMSKYNGEEYCWFTNAKITINEMYEINSGGDNDGIYPFVYTMLEVGEFKKCLTE